ncbi:MAG TPA: tRNA uridine-5-carboxymethylaminomethyl(34) synthesis GTPase MnmE [Spirochaetia bacterium]|nr:tRNA uridine-5-carboxymethylaminomethyl(34) synthesis GTPase MnmE [Spirochaetia bacterium]
MKKLTRGGNVYEEDTIAAIATPPGEGGIGIVRVSGPEALVIVKDIFRPRASNVDLGRVKNRLVYGHVCDTDGTCIDEVLVGVMRSPHSYTREDVVEINCHGGFVALQLTLEAVLSRGARLAEPGEFTKRAFLNGRLDLAQAEAVADLIGARSVEGHRLALQQLGGRLSGEVAGLQDKLLSLLAAIEAELDFPTDDVGEMDRETLLARVRDILEHLAVILRGFAAGRLYREGVSTVLAGKPNAGKSSLLNALLRQDRAIVTSVPGTTRDVIEETLVVRGIPLRLADTAGLRETGDQVEKLGIERTRRAIELAGLVVLVGDAAAGVTREDHALAALVAGRPAVLAVNKVDLAPGGAAFAELAALLPGCRVVEVSALTGAGLPELEEAMAGMVLAGKALLGETPLVAARRHGQALERARDLLLALVEKSGEGWPVDLLTIDLREAWQALGEITGSAAGEEVIDRIFRDFCLGK